MKIVRGIFPGIAVLTALLAAVAGFGADTPAPAKESCVMATCHPNLARKAEFVHQPLAEGECVVCHVKTGPHSFEKITNPGKVCNSCHDRLDTEKVVHPPVRKGTCTFCHEPHQSKYKYLLRAAPGTLCVNCHGADYMSGKSVHKPVGEAKCMDCHHVHQSPYRKLLRAEGNKLCFSCHSDKEAMLKSRKSIHRPVAENCLSCHNAHHGDYPYNFNVDGDRELCYGCHTDKAKEGKDSAFPHNALNQGKKCLSCHDAHASDIPKQLLRAKADLCLGCHDRTYVGADGKTTANIKEILANNKNHHGPIRNNECTPCHNPHGSNNVRILKNTYPKDLYVEYQPDSYKLCFSCHNPNLAADPETTKDTSFRNGEQNLHYVHVNRTKSRSCRLCHDPHATNTPVLIRNDSPFSRWDMPVGWDKKPTGGSCLPGCHRRFTYDRVNRFENHHGEEPK